MTTKLDGELKRELAIRGDAYTLTLSATGFLLALKGRRKGLEIQWADLVSGEAALATALNASLVAPTLPKPSGDAREHPKRTVRRAAKPTSRRSR